MIKKKNQTIKDMVFCYDFEKTKWLFNNISAFFPLENGDYPVVIFLGGLNTYVLSELYTVVLSSIASHGFFVFGVDYQFPVYDERMQFTKPQKYGKQDIDKFFKQLTWVRL